MIILEGKYEIRNYSEQMTDEELFDFCQLNKELRIERDKDQNIVVMAPVNGESGFFESELIIEIGNWRRQYKQGISFSSSTGFLLPNGAMRAPDASWVSSEQWSKLSDQDKTRFLPLTPEFVVEIRSKSDAVDYLQAKMQEWINNGALLAWLIDPIEKRVYIYRSDGSTEQVEGFNQILSGEDILPGFEFDLRLLNMP